MEKGDRVKVSEAGRRAGVRRRKEDQEGTVTGVSRWINVHWDGLSPNTVYSYHPDYIALAVPNGDRAEKNEREMAEGTRCDGSCNDGLPCHC